MLCALNDVFIKLRRCPFLGSNTAYKLERFHFQVIKRRSTDVYFNYCYKYYKHLPLCKILNLACVYVYIQNVSYATKLQW